MAQLIRCRRTAWTNPILDENSDGCERLQFAFVRRMNSSSLCTWCWNRSPVAWACSANRSRSQSIRCFVPHRSVNEGETDGLLLSCTPFRRQKSTCEGLTLKPGLGHNSMFYSGDKGQLHEYTLQVLLKAAPPFAWMTDLLTTRNQTSISRSWAPDEGRCSKEARGKEILLYEISCFSWHGCVRKEIKRSLPCRMYFILSLFCSSSRLLVADKVKLASLKKLEHVNCGPNVSFEWLRFCFFPTFCTFCGFVDILVREGRVSLSRFRTKPWIRQIGLVEWNCFTGSHGSASHPKGWSTSTTRSCILVERSCFQPKIALQLKKNWPDDEFWGWLLCTTNVSWNQWFNIQMIWDCEQMQRIFILSTDGWNELDGGSSFRELQIQMR